MKNLRRLIQGLKDGLRKLLPKKLANSLAKYYRITRAVIAATIFGFPGKRLKIIAVTGTNGKTTTASYLASIMEAAGLKVAVSTTAYFQIGDKKWTNKTNLTADYTFQMQKFLFRSYWSKVNYVVLEVTAHGLEQQRGLWGINYFGAIMTNLTQDHLDYFKTMERYASAKAKLLEKQPDIIVLNRDDEWYDFFDKYPPKQNKISYGTTAEAESRIRDAKLKAKGSEFNLLVDKNIDLKLKTHLPGKFNVYNAAAAASAAYLLHFDKQDIIRGIGRLESVPGRMQYIDKGQNFNVVIDYAHTPDALKNLLETLAKLTTNRVILVFGACGDRDKTKRPIMGEIAAELANRIVLTDEEPYHEDPAEIRKQIKKGIKNEAMCDEVEDRREGIKKAFTIARKGDTVVITGMGHQEYMKVGSHSIPWNDARVSEELLEELGKSKSQN